METVVDKKSLNLKCLLPSRKFVRNFAFLVFVFYSLSFLGVFAFLGETMHIVKEVLHYGIFLILAVYLTYYEISIFNPLRKYFTKLRVWSKNKLEEIDSKFDDFIFEDVDEQVSCLSKLLQDLLTWVKIPEHKARKVTIKKVGASVLYVPVFIFIIFWDIFFKGIVPFVYDKFVLFVKFVYSLLGINYLVWKIKGTQLYKDIVEIIVEYNLEAKILTIVFVLLFASMEGLGFVSLAFFASGQVIYGVVAYAAKFAVFFPIHSMHHTKAPKMREVSWYRYRETDIFDAFKWAEQRKAYKRVMGLLQKAKAIIKTAYSQFKKLTAAIKEAIVAYIRNNLNGILVRFGLEPLEPSDSSLWDDIKETYIILRRKVAVWFKTKLGINVEDAEAEEELRTGRRNFVQVLGAVAEKKKEEGKE